MSGYLCRVKYYVFYFMQFIYGITNININWEQDFKMHCIFIKVMANIYLG